MLAIGRCNVPSIARRMLVGDIIVRRGSQHTWTAIATVGRARLGQLMQTEQHAIYGAATPEDAIARLRKTVERRERGWSWGREVVDARACINSPTRERDGWWSVDVTLQTEFSDGAITTDTKSEYAKTPGGALKQLHKSLLDIEVDKPWRCFSPDIKVEQWLMINGYIHDKGAWAYDWWLLVYPEPIEDGGIEWDV